MWILSFLLFGILILFAMSLGKSGGEQPSEVPEVSDEDYITININPLSSVREGPGIDEFENRMERCAAVLSRRMGASVADRFRAAMSNFLEEHGSAESMMLISTFLPGASDYEETHSPLVAGQRVKLDLYGEGAYKFDTFRLIPLLDYEDSSCITDIHISKDEPAFMLLYDVKITGVYIATMSVSPNGSSYCSDLLVVYESGENGEDDDDTAPVAQEELEARFRCVGELLNRLPATHSKT